MAQTVHERAGKRLLDTELADIPALLGAYHVGKPDPAESTQAVAFGTSGHRGSSLKTSFNEDHLLAIAQATCDYRGSRARVDRSSSGWTRMPCPPPPWSACSRF